MCLVLPRGRTRGDHATAAYAVFQNHLGEISKSYGLGGAVDGKGGYGWGGANGTKFWIDRANDFCAVFMIQAQRYKPPTAEDFRALSHEAAGLVASPRLRGGDAPGR